MISKQLRASPFTTPLLLLFFTQVILIIVFSGCKKKDTTPAPPPPPPPVAVDTTSYVIRLEEDYKSSNPSYTNRNRAYTFYYDNSKRVIKVGIKNYGPILFDTATCQLFYSGTNKKPDMIITPNVRFSTLNQPLYYDTTYFKYNSANELVSDSSLEYILTTTNTLVKRPLKRYYFYPDNTHTLIDWFAAPSATAAIDMYRRDTLQHTIDNKYTRLMTQFYSGTFKLNYAIAEVFSYSNFVNPLSKLNISGTIFPLIYTPVKNEVLGNPYHKAVLNSNILPYFLDFYSSRVPSKFFLGGFTSGGFLISAQYDIFDVLITPWSQKNWYPSQISVGASTALGDRFIYRYYY